MAAAKSYLKPAVPKGSVPKGGPSKVDGIKGALTRKVGPLPVWGYGVAAIVVYVLYKHFASGAASSATATTTPDSGSTTGTLGTATDNSGAVGGGTASGDAGPTSDYSGTNALLTQLLEGQASATQQEGTNSQALADEVAALYGSAGSSTDNSGGASGSTGADTSKSTGNTTDTSKNKTSSSMSFVTPASPSTNFAVTATENTNAAVAAGKAAPFGGVSNVRTLANGATLTTYGSGRQVEQAKGKSAYVVKA